MRSWPTRHRCETCRLSQVCLACARHCHKGHSTEPYIAIKKKGDKVGPSPIQAPVHNSVSICQGPW